MNTYSTHAAICSKFYDLLLNSRAVSEFVFANSSARSGERGLFVGGMFEVARQLVGEGLALTLVDYTDEMVEIGRRKLPGAVVEKSDLRRLPYKQEFDVIFVIGRVFTHMLSDEDLSRAFESCRRSLRPGGRLFFDNYEDSKIQATNYFNGTVECGDGDTHIRRRSSTTRISNSPCIVRWDAEYQGRFEGKEFSFSDSMEHRAFSRSEISQILPRFGFRVLKQGDNFDDTSFFTLAVAA